MDHDTMVSFADPSSRDKLSVLVRVGARRIIAQAVETELEDFLNVHAEARDALGRRSEVDPNPWTGWQRI